MFLKTITEWLKIKTANRYAKQLGFKIPEKVIKKQVPHQRVGDYCNDCDCNVSECSYFKSKL